MDANKGEAGRERGLGSGVGGQPGYIVRPRFKKKKKAKVGGSLSSRADRSMENVLGKLELHRETLS